MEFSEALSAVLPPRRSDEPQACAGHPRRAGGSSDLQLSPRASARCGSTVARARGSSNGLATRRPSAPALARCNERKDHGQAGVDRDVRDGDLRQPRLVGVFWLRATRAEQAIAQALMHAEDQRRRAEESLAEAQRRMAESLAQTQSTNLDMLTYLRSMSKGAQSPPTPDRIPVTFKLTEETLDGPPVVGCEVQIGSGSNGFNKPDSIRRLSDSSGVADCGVIRPGDWGFRIRRPWDEGERSWQTIGTINVLPGSKVARSIICPKVPPDFVSLR